MMFAANKKLPAATSLGGVRFVTATAIGSAMIAMMPVGAMAQMRDNATVVQTEEVAQVKLSSEIYNFDIAAQPIGAALVAFSRISGIDVVVDGVLPKAQSARP